MYQGHQYPWVTLIDDLEIEAVAPVRYSSESIDFT